MSAYGVFTVVKNGRVFKVEPISEHAERGADWGNTDMSNRPIGGAVHPDDSTITAENGFTNIVTLDKGESPLGYIDELIRKEEKRS